MHCAACVTRVEGALKRVPGVESASVNLATERAQVVYDPSRSPLPDMIEAGEIAAGHPVAQSGTIEVRPLWGN